MCFSLDQEKNTQFGLKRKLERELMHGRSDVMLIIDIDFLYN